MSTSLIYLCKFKESLIDFFNELIELFPNESDFAIGKIIVTTSIPITTIVDRFNFLLTKEVREKIIAREDAFFLEHNMFDAMQLSKFGTIWQKELTDEERQGVWAWVDHFVDLLDRYNQLTKKEK